MKFTKIHGLGNDYIYIEDLKGKLKNLNELAIKLSDRHFGIGADGIIIILSPTTNQADFKMRIFNADGSEAEMCGNGIRGMAKYIYENDLCKRDTLKIETNCGIKNIVLNIHNNLVDTVVVDMGEINILSDKIPVISNKQTCINEVLIIDDYKFLFTAVSIGNPHCVIFIDDIENINIEKLGKAIENHHIFPNKTNVEFVEIIDKSNIKMRVWERGSGETLACGTGATASVVAGVLTNKINNNCKVHLKKGILEVYYNQNTNHAYLKGTNEKVFEGKIKIKKGN